ncbi:MAG: polysaccharide biosynthesis tyrosine autokinase [Bythopirellula sp.]
MLPDQPPPLLPLPIRPRDALAGGSEPWSNPLAVFWRRKWIILVSLVMGLVGSVGYWKLQDEIYQSSAQLLLVLGEATDRYDPDQEGRVSLQIAQIKSPFVTKLIVNQSLEHFFPDEELPAQASDYLEIRNSDNLLTLNFIAATPELSRDQLTAIVSGYQRYLEDPPHVHQQASNEPLITRIAELEAELSENQQTYAQLLKPTPFVGTRGSMLTQMDERLQKLASKRQELQLQKATLERQRLSAAQSNDIAQSNDVVKGKHRTKSSQGIGLTQLPQLQQAAARELLAIELRERLTASRSRGPNRQVQRAAEAAEQARQIYAEFKPESTVEQDLEDVNQAIAAHDELLQKEQKKAQQWSKVAVEATRLTGEMKVQETLLSSFKEQLERRNVASQLETSRLELIAPITLGSPRPLNDVLLLFFLPGTVLSALLGVATAFTMELCDHGFHQPSEIEQRLGVPLLGEVPFISETAAALEHSRPGSLVANYEFSQTELSHQFRKIRSALKNAPENTKGQVVLVASAGHGEGRTFVAANLAAAVAQSGSKTLLVDADLKHPHLHQAFGLLGLAGLAAVLAKTSPWQDTVQSAGRANLDVLTSGQAGSASAELLSSATWPEFLQEVIDRYDYVIVDSPALLDHIDSLVIANSADQILLVLPVGRKSRSSATRVFEMLGTLTHNVVGVVMNNVHNRSYVWRNDPLESFRRMHQPHSVGQPFVRPPESEVQVAVGHPKAPAHEAAIPAQKPLSDYDAAELMNLLNELSTEIQQVVNESKEFASHRDSTTNHQFAAAQPPRPTAPGTQQA